MRWDCSTYFHCAVVTQVWKKVFDLMCDFRRSCRQTCHNANFIPDALTHQLRYCMLLFLDKGGFSFIFHRCKILFGGWEGEEETILPETLGRSFFLKKGKSVIDYISLLLLNFWTKKFINF